MKMRFPAIVSEKMIRRPAEHHILLNFKADSAYVLNKAKQDSDLGFSEVGGLSFSLDGIMVDGGSSHSQVLWMNDVSLNAVFRMEQ